MSLAYSIIVYDESGSRVARLENASNPTYSRSRNSADQVSISLPRTDEKIDEIIIGRRFEILRNAIAGIPERLECSAVVSDRGYSGQGFTVEGFTEEIYLENYLTPSSYGYPLYSENATLDTFFDQFDRSYEVERVKYNWDDYDVEVSNVEFSTDPDYVILTESSPGPPPVYNTSGYITLRFEKTSDQEWDRIRWVSDYDEDSGVTTTIQYRQGASAGAGSFSTAEAGALTDVVGIIPADPAANFMDVRVNFATTNTALTPRLFALEVIKRTPIDEVSSISYDAPSAAAVETPGLEADQRSLLQVLIDACEVTNWDFKLERGVLTFASSLGVDRTNDYALIEGGKSLAPAPFDPLSIPSLEMWFDASDASTITESGGAVSQWDDKSGNGYDLTQATGANQPLTGSRTLNGLNVLDFNGTSHYIYRSSTPTISQPNTTFLVFDADAIGNNHIVLDGIVSGQRQIVLGSGVPPYWRAYAGNDGRTTNDSTAPLIMAITWNGLSSVVRINGVTETLLGAPGPWALTGLVVGGNISLAASFDGAVAEVLIYGAELSASEVFQVSDYLSGKWGISI